MFDYPEPPRKVKKLADLLKDRKVLNARIRRLRKLEADKKRRNPKTEDLTEIIAARLKALNTYAVNARNRRLRKLEAAKKKA